MIPVDTWHVDTWLFICYKNLFYFNRIGWDISNIFPKMHLQLVWRNIYYIKTYIHMYMYTRAITVILSWLCCPYFSPFILIEHKLILLRSYYTELQTNGLGIKWKPYIKSFTSQSQLLKKLKNGLKSRYNFILILKEKEHNDSCRSVIRGIEEISSS